MVGSYSSAKLAPPLMGASVEDYERRRTLHDQKVWYTVQIYPCPITLPATTASSTSRSESPAPIPRKSYRVFRTFEDMTDFASQMEHEFPWLKSASETAVKTGCFVSITLRDRSSSPWPLLKSLGPQFQSDADLDQRKEDLNQYLQQLFSLGPIIGESELVAEFFGIWKTDLDVHLSRQEDRDPLALNSLVSHQFEIAARAAATGSYSPSGSPTSLPTPHFQGTNIHVSIDTPPMSPALWSPTSASAESSCSTVMSSPALSPRLGYDCEGSQGYSGNSPSDLSSAISAAMWSKELALLFPTVTSLSPPIPSRISAVAPRYQPAPSPPGSSYHSTDEESDIEESEDNDEGDEVTFVLDLPFVESASDTVALSHPESQMALPCPMVRYVRYNASTLPLSRDKSIKKSTSLQNLREARYHCLQEKSEADTLKLNMSQRQESVLKSNSTTVLKQYSEGSMQSFSEIGMTYLSSSSSVAEEEADKEVSTRLAAAKLNLQLCPEPRHRSRTMDITCHAISPRTSSSTGYTHPGYRSPLSTSPIMTPASISKMAQSERRGLNSLPHENDQKPPVAPRIVPWTNPTPASRFAPTSILKNGGSDYFLTNHNSNKEDFYDEYTPGASKRRGTNDSTASGISTFFSRRGHRHTTSSSNHDRDAFPAEDHIIHDALSPGPHSHRLESGSGGASVLSSPPVQAQSQALLPRQSPDERATSPIPGAGFLSQYPQAFVATFKIVIDSERIVALQVLEPEPDFQLSVPDLRLRVQKKFERMEMPLPDWFELVWTAWHGQRVVLKNDEELYRAICSSANNKVTLRCEF
ncbi:hypothetical protein BGZ83_010445 [Gryganskiella cystojenkinii]|nr:hypothetical protein BGZ83_010445 [Gryganskiella cystojenkinii]